MVKLPKRPRPEEPLHRQSRGGGGLVVELAPSAFDRNAGIADEYDGDDDEYSRYSSNYFADHNHNNRSGTGAVQEGATAVAAGGRIAGAAASSYDLPDVSAAPGNGCSVSSVSRSCSDYTAPFNGDEEWTPTDSAYGAAIPVFGWIPKPIRKIIEATFLFVLVLAFVVVVISASIKLQGEKKSGGGGGSSSSGSSGNGSYYGNDDDAVAAYNEYEENQAENAQMADDYYGDDDDGNADGGRRWRGRRLLLLRGPTEELDDYREGEQTSIRWHGKNSEKATGIGAGTDARLLRRRVGRTYLW